jgi:hypothetical protein
MGEHLMQNVDHWRIVGEAVAGTSHRQRGLPCQDALCWAVLPDGGLALAVADGAGSASHSEVGASLAVRTAIDAAIRLFTTQSLQSAVAWQELVQTVFQEALAAVVREAEARSLPTRELASTLILAVADRNGVAAAQIGDGAAVAGSGEEVILLTVPQSGEYLNETTFLTSPGAIEKVQNCVLPMRVDHIALFTDGLQHLALTLPFSRPHTPFFLPLFRFLDRSPDLSEAGEELRDFLSSARVREKTDDDVSLALACFLPDTKFDADTSQG